MTQITARVPEELAEALDAAAAVLKRSRADVVRQALERYLRFRRPFRGGGADEESLRSGPGLG